MESERREVGRVIFGPGVWRIQTLRNHVDNVVKLIDLWAMERSFLDDTPHLRETRPFLRRAAVIHDMGKPRRFRLTHGKPGWAYSFAGHRFDAIDDSGDDYTPYVEALAHLHHEYSVDGITRHMAQLQLDPRLSRHAAQLPLDLYILEMCDQIEASVASAFLGDHDPTARMFMDFQFGTADQGRYRLEPFVFLGEAIVLTLEWAEVVPARELTAEVTGRTAAGSDANRELNTLRDWLVDELQRVPILQSEVVLCPWNQ